MKSFLESFLISLLAVFAPIQATITMVGVLILADLVTGMIAASKRKEKISSAAMRRTVTKMFVYEAALMIGYLTEHYLVSDFVPIAKLVAGTIGLVELKSVYENLSAISNDGILDNIIDKLGSENEKITKKDDEETK